MTDLTKREREQFAEWKLAHPLTSPLTLMSWIEGGRHEPSKDPAFLREAALAMPTADEEVESHLGPAPEYVRESLAGRPVELSAGQREFAEAWQRAEIKRKAEEVGQKDTPVSQNGAVVGPKAAAASLRPATLQPAGSAPPPLPGAVLVTAGAVGSGNGIVGGSDDLQDDEL